MHSFGCVLTNDERFVFIFGCKVGSSQFTDDIYVLDLRQMRSMIKCPIQAQFVSFKEHEMSSNELDLLLSGFLKGFGNAVVPVDIAQMMSRWLVSHFVHLVKRGVGTHWKMDMNVILNTARV